MDYKSNLQDITGWEEDIYRYVKSPEHEEAIRIMRSDTPEGAAMRSSRFPVKWIPAFLAVVARNPEIQQHFVILGRWVLANHYDADGNPRSLDGPPEDFPQKSRLFTDWFVEWFCFLGMENSNIYSRRFGLAISFAEIIVRFGTEAPLGVILNFLKGSDLELFFDLQEAC